MKIDRFVVLCCVILGLFAFVSTIGAEPTVDATGHVVDGAEGLTTQQLEDLAKNANAQPFQTEVSRLMNILINSLYTNKEVFLRELVSNGVDALDKLRFMSLTNMSLLEPNRELHVLVYADSLTRTLHIRDTGIGMTAEELAKNLGTIAQSGTVDFLRRNSNGQQSGALKEDLTNLIGQFGVGFYSAFLVADRVSVVSKSHDDPVQHVWQSDAAGSFTVTADPRGNTLGRGAEVILHLKEDSLEWLEQDKLRETIRRYAQFVTFPIKLLSSSEKEVEDDEVEEVANTDDDNKVEEAHTDDVFAEEETEVDSENMRVEDVEDENEEGEEKKTKKTKKVLAWDWETLNSLAPIWTRSPQNVKEDEYIEFYKVLSHSYKDPLSWSHFSVEGDATFKALLYIPHELSQSVWSPQVGARNSASNIRLFVRHVFVTEQQVFDLLPPWLRFMVGVVDSDDLPINVGRETIQETKMVDAIKKKLISKSLGMMTKLFDDDANFTGNYSEFYSRFGAALKLGAIEDSENRDKLLDLQLFDSTSTVTIADGKVVAGPKTTLRAYVERMKAMDEGKDDKEKQRSVLYLTGTSLDEIRRSPLLERVVEEGGREVLLLSDPMDEYMFSSIRGYNIHRPGEDRKKNPVPERIPLVDLSRNENDLRFLNQDEKKKQEQERWAHRVEKLADWMKEAVGMSQLDRVVASKKLRRSPAIVTANEQGLTSNMERIVRAQTMRPQEQQALLRDRKVATRVLELNPQHPLIRAMTTRFNTGHADDTLRRAAKLLYHTALATSGYLDDEPEDLATNVYALLSETLEAPTDPDSVEKEEVDEKPEEKVETENVDKDEL